MMEKALNEAGITISFPQRYIHFDSSKPLQIEVSTPSDLLKPDDDDM